MVYGRRMAEDMKQITVQVSSSDVQRLDYLKKRTGISSYSSVIRFAVVELAKARGWKEPSQAPTGTED